MQHEETKKILADFVNQSARPESIALALRVVEELEAIDRPAPTPKITAQGNCLLEWYSESVHVILGCAPNGILRLFAGADLMRVVAALDGILLEPKR